MPNKKGGSQTGFPSSYEISRLSNLNLNKRYTDFNYDAQLNSIKLSNFAGGSAYSKKKVKKFIVNSYASYLHGGGSTIKRLKGNKKITGGFEQLLDLTVQRKDIENIAGLDNKIPYQIPKVSRISDAPFSNFQL